MMKTLVSTYPLCWREKSVPLVYHPTVPPIPSVEKAKCVHPLCQVLTRIKLSASKDERDNSLEV